MLTKRLLCLLAILSLVSFVAFAQTNVGSITGTVTDSTGAIVKDAKVTVTSVVKGTTRTATSNAQGLYNVTNLNPEEYKITVEAPGFAKYAQKIVVAVGSHNEINPVLKVGGAETVVEVKGETAVAVETTNSELSTVVTEAQVNELPSVNRNPYDFVATAGNVSKDPDDTSGRGAGGFNLNGGRAAATDIQLDGAENADLYGAGVGQTVPIDAVQEYRVVSSGMGAEYGRSSTGVVNVQTKSGSNSLHGSLYEFNRLSAYASNDYNSKANEQPKAVFTRNQFGYSVGGPIIKNKLFFFSTTEWTRVRSSANQQAVVYDPSFIGLADANSQEFYNAYGTLRTDPVDYILAGDTRLTGKQTDPDPANWTWGLYGNPNKSGTSVLTRAWAAANPTARVFDIVNYAIPADSGGGTPQNTYSTLNRIDWNVSEKTTFYGRYSLYSELDASGSNSNSPYVGYDTGYNAYTNNFLAGFTHIFNQSVVSETKFLFSRLNTLQPLNSKYGVAPTLYINGNGAASVGSYTFAAPGYLPFNPGSAIPFGGPQNYGQLLQGFSITKGKHEFKVGGYYMYIKDNHMFGAYENAVDALTASGWGNSFDNFLAGHLYSLQVAIDGQGKYPCVRDAETNLYNVNDACTVNLPVSSPSFARSNRYHDAGAYVTDSYKLSPRLTLNLGVRWEYYGPQHNNNAQLDSNFYFGTGDTIFDRIANGAVKTVPNSGYGALWKGQWGNFAPRIGFAYDVFGNGKTSVHGGYGMGYERNFNNVTYNVIQNPPGQVNVTFTQADLAPGEFVDISANNLGQFATGTGSKYLPNASLRAVNPDMKTAYNEFWNLGVEHEIAKNTVVSATYSGSHGVHLYSIANINRAGFGYLYMGHQQGVWDFDAGQWTVAPGASRINTQYSNINFRSDDGFSRYNGLNLGLRSSNLFNLGLQMNVQYTYAHAIDNLSSTFTDSATNANNLGFLDPFNPALDEGNADYDIRHRLTIGAVWNLPFAKNSKGVTKQVLGGWELAPILTFRTGTPFSVFDCSSFSNASGVCSRAYFSPGQQHKASVGAPDPEQGPNQFVYLSMPNALTGYYTEPFSAGIWLWGYSDYPTCTGLKGEGCAYPAGMSGRNEFRGVGAYNVDLSVSKEFAVTERYKLQFRSEFFNLLNHATVYPLTGGNNDLAMGFVVPGTEGTPYIAGYKSGRRFIQFALKFKF